MHWGKPSKIQKSPGFIEPCIPTLAKALPAGDGWVHEIKHDGYRLVVRRTGKRVRIYTRRGYDWTQRFPRIVEAVAELRSDSIVLDGEAVVCGPDGIADFALLHAKQVNPHAVLYAFDLLELDGTGYREEPLEKRKAKLENCSCRIVPFIFMLSGNFRREARRYGGGWSRTKMILRNCAESFAEGWNSWRAGRSTRKGNCEK